MKPQRNEYDILTSKNIVQFTMRMNSVIYEKLKKSAQQEKRSITKHLEYLTEQALLKK